LFRLLVKKRSNYKFGPLNVAQCPFYRGFRRFSTELKKLPPKSVGASVDKVFAILCKPRRTCPASFRSKNNQWLLKTGLLDKSRIFFGFCGESFA
jgi:hypothetical protein